jgi:ribosomal protein L29
MASTYDPREPGAAGRGRRHGQPANRAAHALRELPIEARGELEKELRWNNHDFRMRNHTNRLDDSSQIRKNKRQLARLLTIAREEALRPQNGNGESAWKGDETESHHAGKAAGADMTPLKDANRAPLIVSASGFLKAKSATEHVDIVEMDIAPKRLFDSPLWSSVKTLDASQLQIGDLFVRELAASRYLKGLWWLDLAGNPEVTRHGVETIAKSVRDSKLPKLRWLNLLGTKCDATPYIDGIYWRMTRFAEELAGEFGPQPWMTLGTGKPEMSGREPLRPAARQLPPDRFMQV